VIQSFEGKTPRIHADAFVHPDCTIIGDVEIGPFATIWPSVVLRGDMGRIVIGAETSIQDGSVVHLTEGFSDTIVGARVTVGHRVVLHGCVVEDECLIGMGAIVLDNAHVGRGSVVGAGALLTYGKKHEPESLLIGSPAVRTRACGDRERALIEGGWRTYVDYGRRYQAELSRR